MGKKPPVINADFVTAKRKELGINQSDFWKPVGVTQSGGSRYEAGRNIPAPVRKLIYLVYVNCIDAYQLEAIGKV